MSDETQPSNKPAEPVNVTLQLPAGLVGAYDELVENGIYRDRETALLHAIVEGWRHNRGSYQTVRIDVRREQDEDAHQGLNEPREAPEG